MGSVWQRVAKLNKTLMSSSSISTSGMSRTWSELVVSASKLNIAKYSEDVVKPATPSIAAAASVVVFPMSINNLNIFMELLVGHHHADPGFCCWGRWCCEIKLSRRRDGVGVAVILLQQGGGELKREIEERDRGTQETREEPEEAATGRVGNNEDCTGGWE
ncbi:unnamed protein product [Sphagnum jensenii]